MGLIEAIMDIPAEQQSNVFGQFDAYAKKDVYKRQAFR